MDPFIHLSIYICIFLFISPIYLPTDLAIILFFHFPHFIFSYELPGRRTWSTARPGWARRGSASAARGGAARRALPPAIGDHRCHLRLTLQRPVRTGWRGRSAGSEHSATPGQHRMNIRNDINKWSADGRARGLIKLNVKLASGPKKNAMIL